MPTPIPVWHHIPADSVWLTPRSPAPRDERKAAARERLRSDEDSVQPPMVSGRGVSWVLRGHIQRTDILTLISCAYLDYLKINERFQIWLIVLGFTSRRAVYIKLCQYKSFPRTIKQWTIQANKEWQFRINVITLSPLLETSRQSIPGVRFSTKQRISGT